MNETSFFFLLLLSVCMRACVRACVRTDTANTGVTPLAVSVAPPAPHTAAVAVEDLNSQVAVKSPPPVLASTAPAPVTPSPDTECRATVLRGHSSEVQMCSCDLQIFVFYLFLLLFVLSSFAPPKPLCYVVPCHWL